MLDVEKHRGAHIVPLCFYVFRLIGGVVLVAIDFPVISRAIEIEVVNFSFVEY